MKYSTFDRELLAAFAAIRHFRFILEGRSFRLLTDHMPLALTMHRVSAPWSARQVRQLAYISEFTTDLRHVPGKRNIVADALSRPSAAPPLVQNHARALHTSTVKNSSPFPQAVQKSTLKNTSPPAQAVHTSTVINSSPLSQAVQKSTVKNSDPISGSQLSADPELLVATIPVSTTVDYAKMAELQRSCTECTQMCNSTVLFVVTRKIGNSLLPGDISNNVFRPLVPVSMRAEIISAVHNVAHPGVEATVRPGFS